MPEPFSQTILGEATSRREVLQGELTRRLRRNPRYSLRAFAKLLGLSPGELSELLSGKRQLTVRRVGQLSRRLGWSELEQERVLELSMREKAEAQGATPVAAKAPLSPSRRISEDLFRVVADWYCLTIVCLAEIPGFCADPRWIARRLGISVHEAREALERLERVGLLERVGGSVRVCPDFVWASTDTPSQAIRDYHRQLLEKAIGALESQAPEERDITGICLAIDPRDLPGLRREVEAFQNHLAARYSKTGRKKEVYQLESALFRLTHKTTEKRK